MKQKRKIWTIQEISKLVTAGNNSINKNKTFKDLSTQLGRSFHQCRNKYYECEPNFKTEIGIEERETAIRRLVGRGVSNKEIANMHGVTSASIALLSKQSSEPQDSEAEVKPLFESKQERDDKIRELYESGKSHRIIAKEVSLGKTFSEDTEAVEWVIEAFCLKLKLDINFNN